MWFAGLCDGRVGVSPLHKEGHEGFMDLIWRPDKMLSGCDGSAIISFSPHGIWSRISKVKMIKQ